MTDVFEGLPKLLASIDVAALRDKHRELAELVEAEQKKSVPDLELLRKLKTAKCAVKTRITEIGAMTPKVRKRRHRR